MRNIILASATVLAMALSAGTGFAAQQAGAPTNSGSSVENHCASILAEREAHSKSDVQACEAQY